MRGSLVTIAAPSDFGKPRPALVIQTDLFKVMVDKAITVRRTKLGPAFGRVEDDVMVQVER